MGETGQSSDSNGEYTGWDLPENPELRAWIESLPPLSDEALFKIRVELTTGEREEHLLLLVHTLEQAIEEFDLMFLAAHNGGYEGMAQSLTLFEPEVDGVREEIAHYDISRN